MMLLRLSPLVFTLLAALFAAAPAHAVPAMQDYWRLTCPTKAKKSPLDGACQQNAAEKRRYDAQAEKFTAGGGKGAPPQEDHRSSIAQVKALIPILDAKAKQNKGDAKAAYALGFALGLVGDDYAVNRLDDAINAAKNPELQAKAELAMAEFLFEKKGAAAALGRYKKVLKLKDWGSAAYARYKLAWIDYATGVQSRNPALKKQALTALAQVSRDATAKGEGKKKKTKDDDDGEDDEDDDDEGESGGGNPFAAALAKIVKDDILNLSVDYGNAGDVQQILKSVGAIDVYATFLERAAYVKWEAGQAGEAYKMFALTIKELGKKAKNPQLNLNLALLSAQMNNVPLLLSNLKVIANTYLKETSAWRKKQKPADLKKTDKLFETPFFDFCAALDQQTRKDQQPKSLAAANEAYDLFIGAFPKSPKAYEARFYSAQLLFIQKSFLKSAQNLVAMIQQNPKGKFTKDALDIMVTAAQTAVDADKTSYAVAKMGSIKKPRDIPPIRKTYAESLELYLKNTPRTDKTPAMKFVSASVYYDYGHYKESIKSYWSLIGSYPTDPFARQAAQRVLEYYKQQKSEKAYAKAKDKIGADKALSSAPELAAHFAKPKDKDGKKGKKKKKDDGSDADVADAGSGSASGSASDASSGSSLPVSGKAEPAAE